MPPEKRTFAHLVRELVGHPFFPLLFIGEFVKAYVESSPHLEIYLALAICATLIWVFSDSIRVDVDTDSIIR